MLDKIVVSQWMGSPVVTVSPDTPLGSVHNLMQSKRIRRLPVVDQGKLVGIITIGDVREAEPSDATSLSIWEINYLWSKLTVRQAMTREVVTVRPEDTIITAARLMLTHKIGGLPVVSAGGELVGILTESDIFRMLISSYVDEQAPQGIQAVQR